MAYIYILQGNTWLWNTFESNGQLDIGRRGEPYRRTRARRDETYRQNQRDDDGRVRRGERCFPKLHVLFGLSFFFRKKGFLFLPLFTNVITKWPRKHSRKHQKLQSKKLKKLKKDGKCTGLGIKNFGFFRTAARTGINSSVGSTGDNSNESAKEEAKTENDPNIASELKKKPRNSIASE